MADQTWIDFCYFMPKRSDTGEGQKELVKGIKKFGFQIKFIQCGGAGENTKQIQDLADTKPFKQNLLQETHHNTLRWLKDA